MLSECVCKLRFFQLWRLQTLVNYIANRSYQVAFLQSTRLGFRQKCYKTLINTSQRYDCCWNVSLNSIANVVFFDNTISQRSATLPPCGIQVQFIVKTSDDMSLMIAGYPICVGCPLKQCIFVATDCSLGCFWSVLRWVYAMLRTSRKVLETLKKTMTAVVHYRNSNPRSLKYQREFLPLNNKNCCNSLLHLEYQWSAKHY
jgi:hypothetical protein